MDIFDSIQHLYDESILSGEAYKAVLKRVVISCDDDDEKRKAAFLLYLMDNSETAGPDEVEQSRYDETTLEYAGRDYLVLTDDEADEKVSERIGEDLWAFRPEFLECETGVDSEAFKALQAKCESGNDAVRRIVEKTCGLDEFVKSAVSADGRGHFLAQYDHEENESGDYFIYRTG